MLSYDTPAFRARFVAKTARTADGHLCWTASTQQPPRPPYGQVGVYHRPRLAHRIAWELATGEPLQPGQEVAHTCDLASCVLADDIGTYTVGTVEYPRRGHLFLTDHAGNMTDKHAKGRETRGDAHWAHLHPERVVRGDAHWSRTHPDARARGERHGSARLTEADIHTIDQMTQAGMSQAAIARAFGVRPGTIGHVVYRRHWAHVPRLI